MKKIVLITAFVCSAQLLSANPLDSIGIKKENGKTFLLHKITKGETLYGLNRKYNVSVDDLKANNPGIETSLKIGDVIKVPRSYAAADVVKPTTTVAAKAVKTATTKKHTVVKGETLNAISKKYGVTVDDIVAWNNIKGNNIQIGQVLTINPSTTATVNKTDTPTTTVGTVIVKNTDGGNTETVKTAKPEGGMPVYTQNEELQNNRFEPQYEGVEINETGKISISNDHPSLDANRNFVLHHSARIGTILMVTNPSTNQSVFARVVGNFKQEGDNKNVLVIMPGALSERLALSGNTSIKVNYAK